MERAVKHRKGDGPAEDQKRRLQHWFVRRLAGVVEAGFVPIYPYTSPSLLLTVLFAVVCCLATLPAWSEETIDYKQVAVMKLLHQDPGSVSSTLQQASDTCRATRRESGGQARSFEDSMEELAGEHLDPGMLALLKTLPEPQQLLLTRRLPLRCFLLAPAEATRIVMDLDKFFSEVMPDALLASGGGEAERKRSAAKWEYQRKVAGAYLRLAISRWESRKSEFSPSDPTAFETWITARCQLFDEARVDMTANWTRRSPNEVEPWLEHGDALRGEGRRGDAAAAYRQATVVRPGNYRAWEGLGTLYKEMGATREAVSSLETAVSVHQSEWEERRTRFGAGDYSSDRRVRARLLSLLGQGYKLVGDRTKAIRALEEALTLSEANEIPGLLARLYVESGRIQEAAIQFRLAWEKTKDPFELYNLALVTEHTGDIVKAISLWETYIDAAEKLLQATTQRQQTGELREARATLEETIKKVKGHLQGLRRRR